MGRKCALCEKEGKSKGVAENSENVELTEQIASLVKQPRVKELMKRLKSLGEAVK